MKAVETAAARISHCGHLAEARC